MTNYRKLVKKNSSRYKNPKTLRRTTNKGRGLRTWLRSMTEPVPTVLVQPEMPPELPPAMPPAMPIQHQEDISISFEDIQHARHAVEDEERLRLPPPRGGGRVVVNTEALNKAIRAYTKAFGIRATYDDQLDYADALQAIVIDEKTNPWNYPNYPSRADYNPYLYRIIASGRKYRRTGRNGRNGRTRRSKK